MAGDEGFGQPDGPAPGAAPSGPPAPGGQLPGYGPPPSPYGPPPAYPPPSGYGLPSYGQPMLASAADRERATDILKVAFGEGRLSKDEFDTRCGRVMNARSYNDLYLVVADLPGGSAFAPPPPSPYAGYPMPVRPPSSSLAIGSLVCGILEFATFGATSIPAVILGHLAKNEIRRTGKQGNSQATAGLILGYLAIGMWALFLVAGIAAMGG